MSETPMTWPGAGAGFVRLIEQAEVKRDKYGFWDHPDMPKFEEHESLEYAGWKLDQGLETKFSWLEDEPEDHPVYMSYFNDENADFNGWNPAKPEGDGWFTLFITDTEDGPVWVWARRKA